MGSTLKLRALRCRVCVALTCFALVVPPAMAGLSEVVLSITAVNSIGRASYTVTVGSDPWDALQPGEHWGWSLGAPLELRASGGELVACLNSAELTVFYDPQVNLVFSVQAGGLDTTFLIQSALLSFPTIYNAEGRASASFTVTDGGGGGAVLSPLGSGAYLAQYNGFVPGGTTFTESISQIVAPEFGTQTQNANVPPSGYLSIANPVNDMSAQVSFMLTAFDLASGTTNFEIVPEPSALALLALGAMLLRRR